LFKNLEDLTDLSPRSSFVGTLASEVTEDGGTDPGD
jgi:hypothetical protein